MDEFTLRWGSWLHCNLLNMFSRYPVPTLPTALTKKYGQCVFYLSHARNTLRNMEETQRMDAEQRRDCLQRISDISRVMASSIDIDTDDEQLSVAYAEYTELLRKIKGTDEQISKVKGQEKELEEIERELRECLEAMKVTMDPHAVSDANTSEETVDTFLTVEAFSPEENVLRLFEQLFPVVIQNENNDSNDDNQADAQADAELLISCCRHQEGEITDGDDDGEKKVWKEKEFYQNVNEQHELPKTWDECLKEREQPSCLNGQRGFESGKVYLFPMQMNWKDQEENSGTIEAVLVVSKENPLQRRVLNVALKGNMSPTSFEKEVCGSEKKQPYDNMFSTVSDGNGRTAKQFIEELAKRPKDKKKRKNPT